MFKHPFAIAVRGSLALCTLLEVVPAIAATDEGTEQDHLVILELGASGEREISEHTSHIGPAVGLEIEPIENWLEIELGASTNSSQGARNWEIEMPVSYTHLVPAAAGISGLMTAGILAATWKLSPRRG